MTEKRPAPRSAKIVRWIARAWSILVFLLVILIIFVPEEKSSPGSNVNPIAFEDAFLLSLYGVSVLGLLLAWWQEAVGGIMTITCSLVQQVAFWGLKNFWDWMQILPVLFLTMPAALFLIAWGLERRARKARP